MSRMKKIGRQHIKDKVRVGLQCRIRGWGGGEGGGKAIKLFTVECAYFVTNIQPLGSYVRECT